MKPNRMLVSRVREIRLSLYCEFHSTLFPLDTQLCTFGLSNEDARILSLFFDPNMKFNTTKTFEKDEFTISTTYEDGYNLKHASYVGFHLKLKRILSPFVFQYYLPAASVVFLSQISLIIPLSSIPGRIGLLATLFLALTNLFINHMVLYTIHTIL